MVTTEGIDYLFKNKSFDWLPVIDRWQIQIPAKCVPTLFQTVSKDDFSDGSVKQTIWCVR